jgi:hypothetical protein
MSIARRTTKAPQNYVPIVVVIIISIIGRSRRNRRLRRDRTHDDEVKNFR